MSLEQEELNRMGNDAVFKRDAALRIAEVMLRNEPTPSPRSAEEIAGRALKIAKLIALNVPLPSIEDAMRCAAEIRARIDPKGSVK